MKILNVEELFPAELEKYLAQAQNARYKAEAELYVARNELDKLQDAKKSYFAVLESAILAKTNAQREREALISPKWGEWLKGLDAARCKVRDKQLEYNNITSWWETIRSLLTSKNKER